MKKTLSFIIICALLLSMSIFPTFAQDNKIYTNLQTDEHTYIDRLFELYPDIAEAYMLNEFIYNEIGELDIDCDDAVDFAIIFAHYSLALEVLGWSAIGDRVITSQLYSPFEFGYALYDIEKDSFIEFSQTIVEDYPFLPEYMDKYKIGSPFGDADGDKILSIMDATLIQLVCAKLVQYPSIGDVYSDNVAFTSDCNRDGVLDILDATAIQLKLAGI